jgi:glycosyltransferase involved in cell wall biosynthesis
MSAFALDKPVIATKVGALQEMVVNERHGFLVQPKDTKELENAIRKIIQPEIGKQMSDFIQKDYSSGEHSWQKISAKVLDIYNAILQKKH